MADDDPLELVRGWSVVVVVGLQDHGFALVPARKAVGADARRVRIQPTVAHVVTLGVGFDYLAVEQIGHSVLSNGTHDEVNRIGPVKLQHYGFVIGRGDGLRHVLLVEAKLGQRRGIAEALGQHTMYRPDQVTCLCRAAVGKDNVVLQVKRDGLAIF
ncbi:hypothetical protein D3C72_1554830 [compost metagenome]